MSSRNQKIRAFHAVVAVGVILLYCLSITPALRIGKDPSLYLLLAKSLASGQGYTVFALPHTHVPPGYPLLISPMFFLSAEPWLLINIFMVICALATLYLSYRLLRNVTGSLQALAMIAVIAVGRDMIQKSTITMSDVPFMLLTVASLLCAIRFARGGKIAYGLLGSAAAVASIWVRVVGIPFAAGISLGIAMEAVSRRPRKSLKKPVLIIVLIVVGVMTTTGIFAHYHRRVKQQNLNAPAYSSHIVQLKNRSLGAWSAILADNFFRTGVYFSRLFTAQRFPRWVSAILFWFPMIVGTLASVRRRRYIPVCACWGYILPIMALKPVLARYALPVLPVLLFFEVEGLKSISRHLFPRIEKRWILPAVSVGIMLAMSLPVALNHDFRLQRTWITGKPPGKWTEGYLQASAVLVEEMTGDDRYITTGNPYTLGLLSGKNGYPLAKSTLRSPMKAEELIELAEKCSVSYYVIERDRKRACFEDLLKTIGHREDFREIHATNEMAVYYRPSKVRASE